MCDSLFITEKDTPEEIRILVAGAKWKPSHIDCCDNRIDPDIWDYHLGKIESGDLVPIVASNRNHNARFLCGVGLPFENVQEKRNCHHA